MNETKKLINGLIMDALGELVSGGIIPAEPLNAFAVETADDASHGDFSCNIALVNAKILKMPPRKIAESVAEKIKFSEMVAKVEIAGPGFLNFFVSADWYEKAVAAVLTQKENYGRSCAGAGKRVLVEFVSANPTGPMHIGNARGGALGDALAELLTFTGYAAEREFYVNDSGNQIDKMALSLDIRYRGECGEDTELPEDSYHGEDIINHAKNFKELHGDKYTRVSETERKKALIDYALPLNIQTLENDLLKYRIKYDTWFRESTLHNSNAVPRIMELLKQNNAVYEKDGAVWFKGVEYGEKFGVDKDFVLVRDNGVPTYIMPDIAYHYNKLAVRNFDIAVDILGADHHGYAGRMNACLSALGIDVNRLKIILMQMVMLVRGNEVVKLSKRSGKAITLATLLDEVPTDAARFFFNLKDPDTHLNFDLDLAIEESSKNPVYYAQYAHARICSVMKKFGDVSLNGSYVYTQPAEYALIKKIAEFPALTEEAARTFNPSKITRYATQLAAAFHKFYDACRIQGESDDVMRARIALALAAKQVITNVFGILKVTAPERM